ncbi:hypothetical protein EF294_14765 [Gordonia oryzae]|uniref:Uncharacterized protein n=1 Tax=Gordonia oryzae TaxID=2487349 RepID=A0A3N4GK84_9ACTN|nr:hypothetical protein EF294_14765 [Gordonia oryzae]
MLASAVVIPDRVEVRCLLVTARSASTSRGSIALCILDAVWSIAAHYDRVVDPFVRAFAKANDIELPVNVELHLSMVWRIPALHQEHDVWHERELSDSCSMVAVITATLPTIAAANGATSCPGSALNRVVT